MPPILAPSTRPAQPLNPARDTPGPSPPDPGQRPTGAAAPPPASRRRRGPVQPVAKDGYIKLASPRRPLEAIAEAAASPPPKRGGPRTKTGGDSRRRPRRGLARQPGRRRRAASTGPDSCARRRRRRAASPNDGRRRRTCGRRGGRDDLRLDFGLSPSTRGAPHSSEGAFLRSDDDPFNSATAARRRRVTIGPHGSYNAHGGGGRRACGRPSGDRRRPSSFRARGYRRPWRGAAGSSCRRRPAVQQLGPPVQSTPSPNMQPQSRRKRGGGSSSVHVLQAVQLQEVKVPQTVLACLRRRLWGLQLPLLPQQDGRAAAGVRTRPSTPGRVRHTDGRPRLRSSDIRPRSASPSRSSGRRAAASAKIRCLKRVL